MHPPDPLRADERNEGQGAPTNRAPGEGGETETIVRDHPTGHDVEAEERLSGLIESAASAERIAREAETAEPADAADALESMPSEVSGSVLTAMGRSAAAEALAHMELPLAATVVEDLTPGEAAGLIREMDPDDAADLLQALPEDVSRSILAEMPRRKAATLGKLVLYDPETAGGLMSTNVVRVSENSAVAEAIDRIRRREEDEELYHIYCIDSEGRLTGIVGLRALLLAQADEKVGDLMDRDIAALRTSMDREDVAREFDRYDHIALPVLDDQDHLMGVVTIDDVIDTIRAEHTEDVLKQVGAGPSEVVYDTVREKMRARTPWLVVNLGAAVLAALVVLQFDDAIAALPLLAVLMPVIANQAGNGGQQSLAVTLRGLVLGEVRKQRVGPLLVRETIFGFLTGVIVGALLALGIGVLGTLGLIDSGWRLGLVAAVSMAVSLAIGCLFGSGIPILMERLKFDPATASTVFLIMLTDMISFAAFLGLAALLSEWLMPASPLG